MSVYKPERYASHIIKLRIGRRYRKFPGVNDKSASKGLERQIKRLIAVQASYEPTPTDLQKWLLELPNRLPRLHKKLVEEGVVTRTAVDSGRPLSELLYGEVVPKEGFDAQLKLYHRNGNTEEDAQRKVLASNPELYDLPFVGWLQSLVSAGRSAEYALLRAARVRLIIDGCKFKRYEDIDGEKVRVWLDTRRREKPDFGHATSNHHLKAFRSFVKWARSTLKREYEPNPLTNVATINEKLDIRRKRRAPKPDEFKRLMEAVKTVGTIFGLPAEDREMLYRVAVGMALRAGECHSLAPESFQFGAELNEVKVVAAYSKHRREDWVPIPGNLLKRLGKWLRGKTPGQQLWPGTWINDPAEMLRRDLAAAGIEYKTDEGYFDFHATRHGGITLGSDELPFAKLMKFARHSKPELTMRYTHTDREELHEAVADLPAPDEPRAKKTTGPVASGKSDQKSDHAAFAGNQDMTLVDMKCPHCEMKISPDDVRAYVSDDASCHQRARRDSNPQLPDRQSGTLTN